MNIKEAKKYLGIKDTKEYHIDNQINQATQSELELVDEVLEWLLLGNEENYGDEMVRLRKLIDNLFGREGE